MATDNHTNPPPWIALVDLSSTDWTPPAGMRVQALSFATAGALKVRDDRGHDVIIPSGSLAAGLQHAMGGVQKVFKTGTDALSIVAWGEALPGA